MKLVSLFSTRQEVFRTYGYKRRTEEEELSCEEVEVTKPPQSNNPKIVQPKQETAKAKSPADARKSPVVVEAKKSEPAKVVIAAVKKEEPLPTVKVKIEPRELKPATSQLDKLIRMVDFDQEQFKTTLMSKAAEPEKTENKALSTAQPANKSRSTTPVQRSPSPSPQKVTYSTEKSGTPAKGLSPAPTREKSASPSPGMAVGNTRSPSPSVKSQETKTSASSGLAAVKPPASRSPSPVPKELTPGKTKEKTAQEANPPKSREKSASPSSGLVAGKNPSRSPSPGAKELTPEEAEKKKDISNILATPANKRAQRRERTMENLVGELEQLKASTESSSEQAPVKTSQRLKPPLLLVTQASLPSTPMTTSANIVWHQGQKQSSTNGQEEDDEFEDDDDEYDEDESYSDEDEEEFESDWEYDKSVCKTLQLSQNSGEGGAGPRGQPSNFISKLKPNPDYDSEFELPFIKEEESRNNTSRGRVSQSNALPPPIFTASVSYDGMDSWDSAKDSLSDEDEGSIYDQNGSRISTRGSRKKLDVDGSSLGVYFSPASFSSDSEYDGQQEVTLTLVQKAALRGSDEEYTSSEYYDSDEYDEDESYSDEDGDDSYGESEEEYSANSMGENDQSDESFLQPPYPPPKTQKNPKSHLQHAADKLDHPLHDSQANRNAQNTHCTALSSVAEGASLEETMELELMELPRMNVPGLTDTNEVDELDGGKKQVLRTTTYAKPWKRGLRRRKLQLLQQHRSPVIQQKVVVQSKPSSSPPPASPIPSPVPSVEGKGKKVDPAKATAATEKDKQSKATTVQPLVLPVSKTEVSTSSKITAATAAAPSAPSTKSSTTPEPKKPLEDKSAIRKSQLNMAEEERKRADEIQKEQAKQKARRSGAVTAMMERFKEPEVKPEPITPKTPNSLLSIQECDRDEGVHEILGCKEPIGNREISCYKRSSRLEPKEDARPKRTYAPIIKPVINDEFDKQMAELREQMKSKSNQLQSEFKDLSHGIHSKSDEAKLKAMESKHKERLGSASTVFNQAEAEKKRWKELHESDVERKHKEDELKVKLKQLEHEKQKAQQQQKAAVEPKKTIRRARKADLVPKQMILNLLVSIEENSSSTAAPESAGRRPSNRRPSISKTEELMNFASPPPSAAAGVSASIPEEEPQTPTLTALPKPVQSKVCTQKYRTIGMTMRGTEAKPGDKLFKERLLLYGDYDMFIFSSRSQSSHSSHNMGKSELLYKRMWEKVKEALLNLDVICRKRKRHPQRKKHLFTRKPFDIDEFLGWTDYNTFDKMDAFFSKSNTDKVTQQKLSPDKKKLRLIEHQKIWISELRDIDKLYKSSELRDIRLSAEG
uniref:Uncharacterized protein n=1 Tax=Ditylenchus dipsaci TaxID=166011 RepID=A0A915DJI0_9BILA